MGMARLRIDVQGGFLLFIQAERGEGMLIVLDKGDSRFAFHEIDKHSLESVAEFFSEGSTLSSFSVRKDRGDMVSLEREVHKVGACGVTYLAPSDENALSIADVDGTAGVVVLNAKDNVRIRDFLAELSIETE